MKSHVLDYDEIVRTIIRDDDVVAPVPVPDTNNSEMMEVDEDARDNMEVDEETHDEVQGFGSNHQETLISYLKVLQIWDSRKTANNYQSRDAHSYHHRISSRNSVTDDNKLKLVFSISC
ncbi:hypothetical protein PsorP6_001506 [Peronosclerospora sorghi]|uniref:Uncharacterized protein n=1 Tax=Peronosclerospora sorghi TaxID=230839 RepID=A0ACC0WQW9_9STRA|nr:hypothetical protein PsorP6_001506 [Peronosclerospora sorghi]